MAGSYDYTPAPRARRYAIIATVVTAVLCVISQIGMTFDGLEFGFLMLPTLAIYLWPTGANPILSVLGIFLLGFFQDYLSYGPTGLWPLTWLVLFLIYRPDLRDTSQFLLWQWVGAAIVLACVWAFQIALAKFVLASSVNVKSLTLSVLIMLVVFPVFYLIREYSARLFGNRNDFYYESPAR